MFVDDDNEEIELFVEAIGSLNRDIRCRASINPANALADLRTCKNLPDLILLDYNMPLLNGLEFVKRLRTDQRLAKIEIVMMSSPGAEVMVPWLIKNNTIVKYISKPNSFEKLKIALNDIL